MKVKRLMFWAVLFCALMAYVVIFESGALRKEKTSVKSLIKVFPFPASSINRIELRQGVTTVKLVRREKLWELSSAAHGNLNQENVESLLSSVADLIKIAVVSEGTKELRQFGLENPELSITLYHGGDSKPVILDIGSDCPAGGSMYAMVRGSNEVIQVGTLLRFSINAFMDMAARSISH